MSAHEEDTKNPDIEPAELSPVDEAFANPSGLINDMREWIPEVNEYPAGVVRTDPSQPEEHQLKQAAAIKVGILRDHFSKSDHDRYLFDEIELAFIASQETQGRLSRNANHKPVLIHEGDLQDLDLLAAVLASINTEPTSAGQRAQWTETLLQNYRLYLTENDPDAKEALLVDSRIAIRGYLQLSADYELARGRDLPVLMQGLAEATLLEGYPTEESQETDAIYTGKVNYVLSHLAATDALRKSITSQDTSGKSTEEIQSIIGLANQIDSAAQRLFQAIATDAERVEGSTGDGARRRDYYVDYIASQLALTDYLRGAGTLESFQEKLAFIEATAGYLETDPNERPRLELAPDSNDHRIAATYRVNELTPEQRAELGLPEPISAEPVSAVAEEEYIPDDTVLFTIDDIRRVFDSPFLPNEFEGEFYKRLAEKYPDGIDGHIDEIIIGEIFVDMARILFPDDEFSQSLVLKELPAPQDVADVLNAAA